MTFSTPTFFSQLSRDLRARIKKKILRNYEEPWMKMRELDIIREVLFKIQPGRCLEWGSGYSTIYFPLIQKSITEWHAIEHHPGWAEIVKNKSKDERIRLHPIPPDDAAYFQFKGKYGPKLEGSYDDFKSYIEFPVSTGGNFDFIFIDGRARKDCLKLAFELVSENGVVIVHDANRDNYFSDLPPFRSFVRFTDFRHHRKEGGIWVGRKSNPVHEILDVGTHERLWKKHNLLAKIFFLR
ncbi:MAG: class I SAM-dependent methyltransferase [Cyclobacteriaceae bacterium]